MNKISELQKLIFDRLGMKTSVKKTSGSMKEYLLVSPMMQKGKYPEYPFDFTRELYKMIPGEEPKPNYFSSTQLSVFGFEDDREHFKRERKPKAVEDMKPREWGSKNSQLRLDKNAKRYADKLRKNPNGHARYY